MVRTTSGGVELPQHPTTQGCSPRFGIGTEMLASLSLQAGTNRARFVSPVQKGIRKSTSSRCDCHFTLELISYCIRRAASFQRFPCSTNSSAQNLPPRTSREQPCHCGAARQYLAGRFKPRQRRPPRTKVRNSFVIVGEKSRMRRGARRAVNN